MRTTITIDDNIYDSITEISRSKGISLKKAVNLIMASGLEAIGKGREHRAFTQKSFEMGKPYSEYDLIKALEAAGDLEAAEIKRELELRK